MMRFITDMRKYYNYEVRAAKTSLKTEVDGSYLNWIWWILEPVFSMCIYYLIFGLVFQAKEQYFTAFLFIGQTMWAFFNRNVLQSLRLIKNNKSIIMKVYIPKYVLLVSNMMVNGFKMIISSTVVVFLMVILRVEISWYALCFIPILLIMFVVTFAICINLMHFSVFIEDLSNLINVLMQLFFYMTGIMYDIESRLGENYPVIADIMVYGNPIALLMKNMRNVLIYKTAPEWGPMLIWLAIAIVFSIIGIRTIYKNENNYVKVI